MRFKPHYGLGYLQNKLKKLSTSGGKRRIVKSTAVLIVIWSVSRKVHQMLPSYVVHDR